MPEQPAAEKTEQPTSRRLRKARQEGQVPQSQELSSVAALVVMVATVTLLAPNLMQWITNELRLGFSCQNDVFADSGSFVKFINSRFINAIWVICPILAALVAATIFANVAVSGLNFTSKSIQFNLGAINPASGLKKLFDVKSGVRLLTSILKLLFVGLIIWFYLHNKLEVLAGLRWAWSAQIIAAMGKLILGLMIRICLVLVVIAIADTMFQKWKYIQDLKMTRQQVKEERKDTEGSPELKARVKKAQFEMTMKRFLQEVPKASVVLVNPTHYAVAIRYDAKTMDTPMLVAKGKDHLAEKIREIARAYGVPILRRPELTRTIYATIEPGQPIPPELYVAVAEVLALIYRLKQRRVGVATR
ncbi:MAG: flagellar biosynthesis protein FlhB [Phycisphaerales bacterium]|jgi:flagellar biosynthetic protein FlhB